jgi:uncharacterized damage-inducible protein DinB
MRIAEAMAQEMAREAKSTRKLLERLPEDQFGWSPHEKSMPLGRLASHVAECFGYTAPIITTDKLQLNPDDYKPVVAGNVAELLQAFDRDLEQALSALDGVPDQHIMAGWKLLMGERVVIDLPRYAVMRTMVLNHHVHHRGQLAVYARMLDVPLPSIYGPSADEKQAFS